MLRENYTPEQRTALRQVHGITKQLIEIEHLNATKYKNPIINLDDATDQAVADICLDNHAPYNFLEEKLREAVTKAQDLGIGHDPFISKVDIANP